MELIQDTFSDFTGGGAFYSFTRSDADCTDRYWGLTHGGGGGLSKTDSAASPSPSDSWDTETEANAPLTTNDMTIIGNDSRNDSGRNKLFVTTDTDISVLNDTGNNTWTANWWVTKQAQATLDSNYFHPIEFFPYRKIGLVGDGNKIHTISRPSDTQNDTITYGRLVFPNEYAVRSIFTTAERAWILCINKYGGDGAIVEWDGFSQTYNAIHKSLSQSPVFGINYKEVPIVVNSKGLILEYTGGGFSPMFRNGQEISLPVREIPGTEMTGATADNPTISPRGITLGEDGLIYLMIKSASNDASYRQGAGIWCLNPITGRLYNKFSLGLYPKNGTHYGDQRISITGGLYSVPNRFSERNLLAGGTIRNDTSSSNIIGIWLLEQPSASSSPTGRGYFITQFIPSDEVQEFWDTLWIHFKRFTTAGSGNSMIVAKAKGTRSLVVGSTGDVLTATASLTSTTTFTVTLAAADDSIQVGDEVEFLAGASAGSLMHITTISGAHGALQTVTVDESMVSSSPATAIVLFDRWKKLGEISETNIQTKKLNIGIDSSYIQFKIQLRGTAREETAVSDLIVTSKSSIKLE